MTEPADDGGLSLLLDQMERATGAGLYLLALHAALIIPDICGALASENGRASGSKYKSWLRSVVYPDWTDENIAKVYDYRCALLHQNRSTQGRAGNVPTGFIEPSDEAPVVHNVSTVVGESRIWWLNVPTFVDDIAAGVRRWLIEHGSTGVVQRNLAASIRRRPDGIHPHLGGAPVIL